MTDMNKVSELISNMNQEEIEQANRMVLDRWDYLSRLNRQKFKVGDKVTFDDRHGNQTSGKVIGFTPKNVKVRERTKEHHLPIVWTISPSLLKKA